MKILFCKNSYMKYYKGASDIDVPYNGGSFVIEHGKGMEEFNFQPVPDENGGEVCLGFVEPKSTVAGSKNQIHIERIIRDKKAVDIMSVDGVLVVFCATRQQNDIVVVGWYKNATVFRYQNDYPIEYDDGHIEYGSYNIVAKKEDCTLLPEPKRNRGIWSVRSARSRGIGFGQSMVWYADDDNPETKQYVDALVKNIEAYNEENWIDLDPYGN